MSVAAIPDLPKAKARRNSSRPVDPENLPKGFELIDGKLTEKENMGFQSGFITVRLIVMLATYLDRTGRGVLAGSDATFACVPGNPRQVRKPDAAVIFCDPKSFVPPIENYTSPPDIVIEVLSPNDSVGSIYQRVEEFLGVGTKQAWIVNPQHRYVELHNSNGHVVHLKSPAIVTSDLLPDFELPLATLFG